MISLDQIRELCLKLPGVTEGDGKQFAMGLTMKGKHKGICWSWLERIEPKKARVANDAVLAVRTPGLAAKEMLLATEGDKLFTEDHYNGYPAVLVRLDKIKLNELEEMLVEAYRAIADKTHLALLENR